MARRMKPAPPATFPRAAMPPQLCGRGGIVAGLVASLLCFLPAAVAFTAGSPMAASAHSQAPLAPEQAILNDASTVPSIGGKTVVQFHSKAEQVAGTSPQATWLPIVVFTVLTVFGSLLVKRVLPQPKFAESEAAPKEGDGATVAAQDHTFDQLLDQLRRPHEDTFTVLHTQVGRLQGCSSAARPETCSAVPSHDTRSALGGERAVLEGAKLDSRIRAELEDSAVPGALAVAAAEPDEGAADAVSEASDIAVPSRSEAQEANSKKDVLDCSEGSPEASEASTSSPASARAAGSGTRSEVEDEAPEDERGDILEAADRPDAPGPKAAASSAPELGDVVVLGRGVPSEYRRALAVVSKVASGHCTVVVLDEDRRIGIGECWPAMSDIVLESSLLRLGSRVCIDNMQGARTRRLNGLMGTISAHPREGHPVFIQKPGEGHRPKLVVCVTFDNPKVAGERSALVEPRFLLPAPLADDSPLDRAYACLAQLGAVVGCLCSGRGGCSAFNCGLPQHISWHAGGRQRPGGHHTPLEDEGSMALAASPRGG
mmetsp:Transcript_103337/g.269165  ORF Transcript_103337/g.269165 Transcript_103337/m.269165 type:complete len:543 (+) Transcript_103337:18-1646(+)